MTRHSVTLEDIGDVSLQAKSVSSKSSGQVIFQQDVPIKQKKLKLLIANDNGFQLLIISTTLLKLPIVGKIDTATNGQEALDLVKKNRNNCDPYDLILLDLDMPILDGYDCCRRIHSYYDRLQGDVF